MDGADAEALKEELWRVVVGNTATAAQEVPAASALDKPVTGPLAYRPLGGGLSHQPPSPWRNVEAVDIGLAGGLLVLRLRWRSTGQMVAYVTNIGDLAGDPYGSEALHIELRISRLLSFQEFPNLPGRLEVGSTLVITGG